MAKTSKIAKNEQRKVIVARHAERRTELKKIIARPSTPDDERDAAVRELTTLFRESTPSRSRRRLDGCVSQPRDSSATRVRNRDAADGRPRGFLRKFGLSRVRMRALAHEGHLPGVRKSGW